MIGVLEITLIVPTLQRGNASQDAPRPLSNVAQSVTGCMPTRSEEHDQCRGRLAYDDEWERSSIHP